MCAKLRTMAASNNRDHVPQSLTIACLRYIYNGIILHTHPVHGESHKQRHRRGCNNIIGFHHFMHVSSTFAEAELVKTGCNIIINFLTIAFAPNRLASL